MVSVDPPWASAGLLLSAYENKDRAASSGLCGGYVSIVTGVCFCFFIVCCVLGSRGVGRVRLQKTVS